MLRAARLPRPRHMSGCEFSDVRHRAAGQAARRSERRGVRSRGRGLGALPATRASSAWSARSGRARSGDSFLYAFLAESKHHNRRGVVQGGMLMTFADRSMGMTCWYANERQPQATVQLDMHFIDAVQVGEFVEAKCKVVRRTRSLIFMSGELVVGDRVVATANGVWKTLRKALIRGEGSEQAAHPCPPSAARTIWRTIKTWRITPSPL